LSSAYNSGTTYYPNDVVSALNGDLYLCILESTGNEVTEGSYWTLYSARGTKTFTGTGPAEGDPPAGTYKINDLYINVNTGQVSKFLS
jgi:hypothetical protein